MKHRFGFLLACLGLLIALSACDDSPPTRNIAAPPADLPRSATPYLFCRTTHTQDYKATSNSPDYDITCWKLSSNP